MKLRQIVREELGRHPLLREMGEEEEDQEEEEGERDPLLDYYDELVRINNDLTSAEDLGDALHEFDVALSNAKDHVMVTTRHDPKAREKHLRGVGRGWYDDLLVKIHNAKSALERRGELDPRTISTIERELSDGLDMMLRIIKSS
jgi:hypothetical protein